MPMNTPMNMMQISIAMNMTTFTNMNTNMPIRMRMLRAAMSIQTTMVRTIMAIRIMALKCISTSTDAVRRKPDGSVRTSGRYYIHPPARLS